MDSKLSAVAASPSAAAPAGPTHWNFAFLCKKTGELQHVDKSGASFTCPACNLGLVWIPQERRLGAHGRDARTIGHELRVAQEA